MSLEDIKAAYKPDVPKSLYIKDCEGWEANVKAYPQVMKYLQDNNCMEAYELYPNRFFFNKVQDRVIFVEYDTINSFKLATGRSLVGETPKWYKYVALPDTYFIAQCTRLGDDSGATTGYVVEDCASACSISRIGRGVGLCGTSYSVLALSTALLGVKDVIICLDPDAQTTALNLQRNLAGFGKFNSVKVAALTNDAKYMGLEQLKKELGQCLKD